MTVRAKFRCTEQKIVWTAPGGDRAIKHTFSSQYQPDVPEDQKFEKATPQGEFWMVVDNPSAHFELGQDYYIDFTPVAVPEPPAEEESAA